MWPGPDRAPPGSDRLRPAQTGSECFEHFEMLPEEIIIYISIYFRDDPQRLGRFRQTTKSYVQFCQVTFNKLHWHFEVYQNFEQQKAQRIQDLSYAQRQIIIYTQNVNNQPTIFKIKGQGLDLIDKCTFQHSNVFQ